MRRVPVDVIRASALWDGVPLEPLAERALAAVEQRLDGAGWQVDLLACDDAEIARLNGNHRGKPKPTNVLSWPSEDRTPGDPPVPDPFGDIALGDLALAYETCRAEAADLDAHITHLIVHGVLHLLGHDHEEDAEAEVMEALESEILIGLGLPDPYTTVE